MSFEMTLTWNIELYIKIKYLLIENEIIASDRQNLFTAKEKGHMNYLSKIRPLTKLRTSTASFLRLLPTRRDFITKYTKKNHYLNNTYYKMTNEITPIEDTGAHSRLFKPIVWIDCEMTGLDHTSDRIIEICCIITDGNLKIVDKEGDNCYESVIHYDSKVMDNMNEWCIDQHGKSGLTAKVLESTKTREQVEEELLAYIKKFIPDPNVGIMAGNSIHMDRLFMLREFPKVIKHLFYRLIDVSTIMEVSRRHNNELAQIVPRKETAHTAKKDILESIAQLQWYQDHYLKNPNETKEFVAASIKEQEKEKSNTDLASVLKNEFNKRPLEKDISIEDEQHKRTKQESLQNL
ncbi:Rex2p NDAI_0C06460 [Naumovozyma dairenensis CBS 421]|uniref:Exonuclease domain-containing protein n=1 Tax=Naumovozyma dairenensis (strain ATCC 10597 / BCRC 20456 / CBS 421 / NBRC 0211 / NRRL Y-12639) TaxID=1071378 RepID=G0W944_NAUDC|nr:hypothetical protein NDAI_0C06460 [Naumovozyma dairenensis CBS 421]CCD24305.1 hypothetical protein NDAI_0C06460 [Naumovozyma dairenensis CBS 421]